MVGSPMGASGFATLADRVGDRTVVTYDPRGVDGSRRTDDATESTPDQHADDLSRLIAHLAAGPVDVFASSGGAVNALALVARHPDQVRVLVAHEPPAAQHLPDREQALAACLDVHETYQRSGFGPAMAKFIKLVSLKGPVPADFATEPAPNPAEFGLPTEDDGSRDDPLVGQNIVSCTHYWHDFDALRSTPTRILVGVGAESEGEMAHRAGVAVAHELAATPVTFPGGHGGFLPPEYGPGGDPEAFAGTLRDLLAATASIPAQPAARAHTKMER
jgi:pimeloyl-ACP methyl ester carboxylesterase